MFIEELDQLLKNDTIRTVELDLKGLTFMDSSGIGAILGRYKKLNKRNGTLRVKNLRPSIRRIFEMSGLFAVVERAG